MDMSELLNGDAHSIKVTLHVNVYSQVFKFYCVIMLCHFCHGILAKTNCTNALLNMEKWFLSRCIYIIVSGFCANVQSDKSARLYAV